MSDGLIGGPLQRYGGKGRTAHLLIPHFAAALTYAEACMGAGGVFFRVPSGTYRQRAVNDLDSSLVTFFRVLRDRPDELVRVCELTPYALEEFIAALEPSDDPLEEARRVWVRSRQGFGGKARSPGDWGRNPTRAEGATGHNWNPSKTASKLETLRTYARSLLSVAIDCLDGAAFIDKWGQRDAMVYADPPYLHETRKGARDYLHEMTSDDHKRFAAACHAAVARGAKVAVSGYPSALYGDLYAEWRRVEIDVALAGTRDATGQRRTEVLWCSYPATDALNAPQQRGLFDTAPAKGRAA